MSKLPNIDSKNPFDVLGVGIASSAQEIKSAFRQLVFRYHPDKARMSSHIDAGKFRLIIRCKDMLLNPMTNYIFSTAIQVSTDEDPVAWSLVWKQAEEAVESEKLTRTLKDQK